MHAPELTQDQTTVLRRLQDEAAIRDLGHRFADACNRGDVAAFRELWHPDCLWVIDHPVNVRAEGVEAVVATLESLASLWDWFVQLPHAPLVDVDGERAVSSWTVSEHAAHADPPRRYDNHARYDDQLVRTEDGWRFRSRHYQYYWIDQDGV